MAASHQVVDLSGAKSSLQCDIFCSEHPDRILDTYCIDHSVVCCMSCVMLNHRACNVRSVEEAARSLKTSDKIDNMKKSLTKSKKVLDALVQSCREYMRKTINDINLVKEDVERTFAELVSHLETLKNKSLAQIAVEEKEVCQKLENERDELQCKLLAVENDMSLYHSHIQNAPPVQFLQGIERLSKQSVELEEFVELQRREMKGFEVCFEMNEKVIEITKMKYMGEMNIEQRKLKNIGDFRDESAGVLMLEPQLVMEKDTNDCVSGVAIVNNDLFILSKFESNIMELLDNKCTLLSSLSLSSHPYGIKMISETEGMVAVCDTMLTAFKVQDNEIMKTKEIIVNVRFDFIFHVGKYFIGSRDKIIVHDSSNRHMRDIHVNGNVGYLAARDETTLCFTLFGGMEVYCITVDGTPVFTYSHNKLEYTTGITIDNAGSIYVCCYSSKTVHQLSHDGKLQRIIFDKMQTQPLCIQFSSCGDKAVVGCYRKVLVYNFK